MKFKGKLLVSATIALTINPVVVALSSPPVAPAKVAISEDGPKLSQPGSPALIQYISKVKKSIERNWFAAADPKGHAVVFFRIAKDGRIFWVELDDCSGTPAVNFAAEDAIKAVGKLPALPAGTETLDLAVEFNSKVSDSSTAHYSRPSPDRLKSAQVLMVEADADSKAKAHEHACQLLEQAYELTPFNAKLRDQLVDSYLAAAVDCKPDMSVSWLHKAMLLDPNNDKTRAKLKAYWKTQSKDFDNYDSVVAVAGQFVKDNRPMDAVAEYCQAWLLKHNADLIPEINRACLLRESYKQVQKWVAIVEREKSADNLVALAKAYESCGDTANARLNFKRALKLDPTNDSARKFIDGAGKIAEASTTLPPANDSDADDDEEEEPQTKDTATLSIVAPPASAVVLTEAFPLSAKDEKTLHISVINNRQNVADYFENVCREQAVHRWTPGRFPLRLFVANGAGVPGYRPIFNQMAINAFAAWCKGSGNRLSYVVVNDRRGANVTLDWTADPSKMNIPNAQGQTFFQFMKSGTGNNTIKGAKISILTVWRNDKSALTDKAMNMVTIHEIGHALGLSGHSPNRSDIMFYAISPRGPFVSGLSASDKATIKHLYQGYEHPAPTTIEGPQAAME